MRHGGWGGTSATLTTNGCIRLWATERRQKFRRGAFGGKLRRGWRRPGESSPWGDLECDAAGERGCRPSLPHPLSPFHTPNQTPQIYLVLDQKMVRTLGSTSSGYLREEPYAGKPHVRIGEG